MDEGTEVVTIPKAVIPKEHGAWAVLLVPMFVGAAVAEGWTWNFVLLVLAALFMVLGYVPAQGVLRHYFVNPQVKEKFRQNVFWAGAYLVAGMSFAIPLLVQGYLLLLVPGFAGMATFLAHFHLTRRFPKTIPADLLAVCGLTLTGPAAYYIGTGLLDGTAALLWLFNVLFFGSSVFYVHMKIRASSSKDGAMGIPDKISIGRLNIIYHVVVIALVVAMSLYHPTLQFAVIAFLPMVLHALYGTYNLSRRVQFKRLGFILLGQSVLFGILLSGVVRW